MAAADAAMGLLSVTSSIDSVRAAATSPIAGIGICAPGPLDPSKGVILNPPNLPAWRNFPLAAKISKTYSLPVKLDNDGNAAALAEALWGAARGYKHVFYATIGTGIGTGIVLDRRIYHGRTGAAAEGGHVTIDYRGSRCTCGKLGCIEALASGTAIARRAMEKIAAGHASSIKDLAGGSTIIAEMVGRAHSLGDRLAIELLRETAFFLTVWLGNIVDLLDPDVMIIGGGTFPLIRPFLDEIRDALPAWTVNQRAREIPLLPAHYGADAGIAGAAALCLQPEN
jgi:glucokinase